jgi:hypothetical protein
MNDKEAWFGEGYEIPVEPSTFMQLEDGDNTFRILSKPTMGYEYWTQDNKPHRARVNWETVPSDIRVDKGGKPTKVKHFWNFLVYNYATKSIQTYEVTQTTIMKALKALIENPKWGSPEKFDITINKTGKELLTKYAVVPNPHSELTEEIKDALSKSDLDPESIFEEGN